MKSSGKAKGGQVKPPLPYDKLYWLVPLLLALAQLAYIPASNNQIRHEELAESVRNVFWLDVRLIYDGVSSNVGYYGLLLIIYKIFGFSLHTAKYVRLVIYVIAMFSLAALLKKFMRPIYAAVILATIGLSPTILFFNTIQTSYGMDILYGIICLLVAVEMPFDNSPKAISLAFLLGSIAMVAAMSYPTSLLYLPSLLFLCLWRHAREGQRQMKPLAISALGALAGFAMPFLFAIVYLKDPGEFLYDPVMQAGVFRGGGMLQFDLLTLKQSASQTLSDIFQRGTSYYYDLQHPDFSGKSTWIALPALFAAAIFIALKSPSLRPIFLLTGIHIFLNFIVPGFASGAGIRRATGFLAGIYAWYAITLWGLLTESLPKSGIKSAKWIGVAACLVLTFNNCINYARNRETIGQPNIHSNPWFAFKDTPDESLRFWLEYTEKGGALVCKGGYCPYAEIYAAIAGFRKWNGLSELPVQAYDPKTDQIVILNPDLWKRYYFRH